MFAVLLLILGFYFCIAMYYQPCRRTTLYYSILTSLFLGLYNYLSVSTAGGLICLIAISNTVFQLYWPSLETASSKATRLIVAALIAIMGTLTLAQTHADYLPMIAFITACFAETATRQINIYKLYAVSVFMWVVYAAMHGDMLYTFLNTNILAIYIFALNAVFRNKILTLISDFKIYPERSNASILYCRFFG